MGTLYIVPTPLGNLEDITLRALRILRETPLVITEDTRTTGRLLKHFDIDSALMSYHEHSGESRLEQLLAALEEADAALVSEAGTPLLSDPGYKLVRAALDRGLEVVSLPGPSAVTTALVASGLPTDRFAFLGFLPRKPGERRQALAEAAAWPVTLICFEAPHRLQATLADMVDLLGPERPVAICRELTKLHEESWRGTLAAACQTWREREARGEFTLVVGGAPAEAAWSQRQVETALKEALAGGASARAAVHQVTVLSGWSKRKVYALVHQIRL